MTKNNVTEDQKSPTPTRTNAQRQARRIPSATVEPEQSLDRASIARRVGLVAGAIVIVVVVANSWQSGLAAESGISPPSVAAGEESVVGSPTSSQTGSMPTGSTTAGPTNLQELWRSRISELDQRRIIAFEQRDRDALNRVNVAGSPAHRHDVQLLDSLENRNAKPVAHKTTIHSAKPISSDLESALVEVVDSRSEYVVTTESMNRTLKRFKANEKARWRVSLQKVDGNWLIYSVVAA